MAVDPSKFRFVYHGLADTELTDKEKAMLEALARPGVLEMLHWWIDPDQFEKRLVEHDNLFDVRLSQAPVRRRRQGGKTIEHPTILGVELGMASSTAFAERHSELTALCKHYRVAEVETMIEIMGFHEALRALVDNMETPPQ